MRARQALQALGSSSLGLVKSPQLPRDFFMFFFQSNQIVVECVLYLIHLAMWEPKAVDGTSIQGGWSDNV